MSPFLDKSIPSATHADTLLRPPSLLSWCHNRGVHLRLPQPNSWNWKYLGGFLWKYPGNTQEIPGKYLGGCLLGIGRPTGGDAGGVGWWEPETGFACLPALCLAPARQNLPPARPSRPCLGGLCSRVQPAPTLTRGGSGSRPKPEVAWSVRNINLGGKRQTFW